MPAEIHLRVHCTRRWLAPHYVQHQRARDKEEDQQFQAKAS